MAEPSGRISPMVFTPLLFTRWQVLPLIAIKYYGGTQDNGVKYKKDAGDFTHITGADGFDCAFGPSASSYIYTTINASVARFDINGNNNTNITPADNAVPPNGLVQFFPIIAADPVTNNTIYVAGGNVVVNGVPSGGIRKSTDGGTTWTPVSTSTLSRAICISPSNANRVYVAGASAIIRTDAEPEHDAHRARELRLHLRELLAGTPLEVLPGLKVVEVRPQGVHKGLAIRELLRPTDRVLALGDDRTDEDLFLTLPDYALTVRVGRGTTVARWRVADVPAVLALLRALLRAAGPMT